MYAPKNNHCACLALALPCMCLQSVCIFLLHLPLKPTPDLLLYQFCNPREASQGVRIERVANPDSLGYNLSDIRRVRTKLAASYHTPAAVRRGNVALQRETPWTQVHHANVLK
jgi:hypothetical protein